MRPLTLGRISVVLDLLDVPHVWDPEGCRLTGTDWVLRAGGGAGDPHRWFMWNLRTNERSTTSAKTYRQLELMIRTTLRKEVTP